MAGQDIVVVGASAGGIQALQQIVSRLPEDYRGSIFVVLHLSPDSPSVLHKILSRAGPLPATVAKDGEKIRPAHIYVAAPDHHLLLEDGSMRVVVGPRENRHRPSIDVLFRSAAKTYGPRVIAVLLSGMRDDGVSGLMAVKRQGGTVLIQKPEEATFPDLPSTAIEVDSPDRVLTASHLAGEIVHRAQTTPHKRQQVPMELERELHFAKAANKPDDTPPGTPAEYACPECNGSLWKVTEEGLTRYRCRVGHAYTERALLDAKAESVESALWAALRALEESASVERRAAERTGHGNGRPGLERLRESAATKSHHAELLREILLGKPDKPTIRGKRPAISTGTEG